MSGTLDDIYAAFKDSPWRDYYTSLANAERSAYDFYVHPTDWNKTVMDSTRQQARTEKARLLYAPGVKWTNTMYIFPDLLGGGYVEGTGQLGLGDYGGNSGSVVDPAATPMRPNTQLTIATPTATSNPTKTPSPTITPSQTSTPIRINRLSPIPRRHGGELID